MESRKSEAPTLDLAPPLETSWLERIFKLKQHGSTVRTELIAGVTTFITMAYIIFVNPNIMADAGTPESRGVKRPREEEEAAEEESDQDVAMEEESDEE